ncbi:MAG: SLBB domain-containing protein [Candidatus Tectomicrobia bacterium]
MRQSEVASPAVQELSPIERLLTGKVSAPLLLRQFGYDLFRRAPTTFAPVTDVPVGPNYVIGAGDGLNIVLWGGVQEYYQLEVDRNGAITLPRLGVVQVWGFTLKQLQVFLQQRFGEFYPNFEMAVTLGKLRTIRVFVVGEVRQPGAYTVSSLSTMINALFASGGPAKNGSLRRISLVRQGTAVDTLDLYNFLLRGDKSRDQTLQSGDTIFVPVIGPVAGIAGNVKRPAIYELEPGMTLRRLIQLAGGITPSGYLQRVHVERFVANQMKVVVDLDLSPLPQPETTDLWQTALRDGDLVRILSIVTTPQNVVRLQGHVVRPGDYELKPGMRLRQLLTSYGDLLPRPYLEHAEIVRHLEPDLRRIVVSFNLGALLDGDASYNLALQPLDIVRVFPQVDFVDPPQVRMSGLVHKPGVYTFTEGMRVRDLVMRAGSVRNFAYLEQAELTRRRIDQVDEFMTRVEINLAQALMGDPEHDLPLQNFDHLLVRQLPDVELRQNGVSSIQGAGRRLSALPADIAQRVADQSVQTTSAPQVFPLIPSDTRAAEALQRASSFVEHTVEILGEVRFPGTYPIVPGERLSSVLRRAGGFSDTAYLRGVVFTRLSVQEAQQKRLQELLRGEEEALLIEGAAVSSTALSTEEVQGQQQALVARRQLINRLQAVRPDGRVVIRLRPLAEFAGSDHDIELELGDRLVIPLPLKYVSVLGQVYNSTSVLYEPGRDLGYYLDKVGGIKPKANEKEIHVVQVDGTVISKTQDQFVTYSGDGQATYLGDFFAVQPQPGDTIIVPRRVVTPATLRRTRDIIQIIFQSLATVGVIAALL